MYCRRTYRRAQVLLCPKGERVELSTEDFVDHTAHCDAGVADYVRTCRQTASIYDPPSNPRSPQSTIFYGYNSY